MSHVLVGKSGNTMRYNFTGGNVAISKCPELTLKSEYAQDLLEASQLFKEGTVVLVRKVESFAEQEQRMSNAAKKKAEISDEDNVTTPDELLLYVNTHFNKRFTDTGKALAYATKEGVEFVNLPKE